MDSFVLTCAYVLAGVLGLSVGSFLNVVIYRVPLGMSLSAPSSHCVRCGYSLRWYDNIPVLSWLLLKGRCRKCREPISPRYPLVELTNAALWLLCTALFLQDGVVYTCLSALVCSALICIFLIDLEHMLIFNRFIILLSLCAGFAMFTDPYTTVWDHVIGLLAGGGVFAGLYFGAIWILGKEGLGFGDVKLVSAAGLLLGWQKLLLAALLASVSGSIVLLTLRRVRGDGPGREYPFGPFLACGILLALLFGTRILTWYTGLLLG